MVGCADVSVHTRAIVGNWSQATSPANSRHRIQKQLFLSVYGRFLVTGSRDKFVKRWLFDTNSILNPMGVVAEHRDWVSSAWCFQDC